MKSPLPDIGPRDAAMGWVPRDACTLPTTEQPLRAAEFEDLFAASLRDIEHCDARRARLVLAGDHRLPTRLQRLVDAESSCCSFFTFTLTRLDAGASDEPGETMVALTIEVPTARAGVLEALVTRADQARQGTP